MRQQLPDAVLFNQRKGLQAADIAGRIRAEAEPIQATLEALAKDPFASHCLDLPRMQQLLTTFRSTPQPNPALIKKLQMILLRGIGVGKFLAG